ncbi:hypothetical protein PROFUN_12022 [Planoprotostelium fungivorum]|uniref:Clu domain-containing protein n=1 Tax=Planoprotostelium fungivorum TaxID=1890364 RepID=A0A2P6MRF1_9EUKA|nr:hypothetical protein PROFUN_12022 [Planoprotostelium fungivorum]
MHRDVSHYENSRSSYDAPRHDALNLGYVIDPSFTSSDGYDGDTFFYLPSRLTEFEDEEEEEHDFYSDPLCQSPQSTNPYDARNHSFFADHSEMEEEYGELGGFMADIPQSTIDKASNISFNKLGVAPKTVLSVARASEMQGSHHNVMSAAVSTVHNTQKSSMNMSLRSNPTTSNNNGDTVGLQTKEELYGRLQVKERGKSENYGGKRNGKNGRGNRGRGSQRNSNHKREEESKMSLNDLLISLRDNEKTAELSDKKNGDIAFERVTWSSSDSKLQPIPIQVKTLNGHHISMQVSMEDSVQVILQSLSEAANTCHLTCFYLTCDTTRVSDFTALYEVPKLGANSVFVMHEDTYDEKSARVHVKRLREILYTNDAAGTEDQFTSCLLPCFEDDDEITLSSPDASEDLPMVSTSISSFFPETKKTTTCVKNMFFSGWNPPPGNRRLQGDLFYLEVETMEDKRFFITGCPSGFYVNESTISLFSSKVHPRWPISHSLAALLSLVSPMFKESFQGLLSNRYERDPFEIYPVPLPTRSWLAPQKPHTYDLNRSRDSSALSNNLDGQFRDWNEEYQSSKELDRTSVRERIVRDHAIIKVNNDFVEAATRGACAIINKTVPPLNPMDPKPVQMYIYNNIFFSYAIDTDDKYEEVEGRYTYTSANNDLKGVIAYNSTNTEGLYTLTTAIIDYRGYRMVAQSMIPGIFNPSTVVYSSTDFDKDQVFGGLLKKAAGILHIPGHDIVDKSGQTVKIYCSAPTKGIVGTDGRRYIIDLCRVTPQDANYRGNLGVMAILRPELINILNESEKMNASRNVDPTDKQKGEKEETEHNIVSLNPDSFSTATLGGTEEEQAVDCQSVESASAYILDQVIPNLVNEFSSFVCIPVDGQTLTIMMHHRGINMRYLGVVTSLSPQGFIRDLCLREMIARSAKHLLRGILFETQLPFLAPAIAHFFNCLLSRKRSEKEEEGKKKKKKKKKNGPGFLHTHKTLWAAVQRTISLRFKYDLSEEEIDGLREVPLFRNLCLKMNIQMAARDYDFTLEAPFFIEDVLDMFPVVKHCQPKTADGHDLLESGVSYLAQGRLDIAFELLSEALVIFSQVYGPMHHATAVCFSNMAMVLYQSGDPAEAVVYQQKAVIINERVQGLDHHETSQSYGNLALFCHKTGKVKLALNYIQRALYLGYLACGLAHPDNGTSFTNMGMILQDLHLTQESTKYFTKALSCCESLQGTDHLLLTAAIYHAMAINYDVMNNHREAMHFERKNYLILKRVVTDTRDPRITESDVLMKDFLQKALEFEKSQKMAATATPSRTSTISS